MNRGLGALVLLALLSRTPEGLASDGPRFADTGIQLAPTWCGREAKPHLLESGGAGLALVDYDRDGDLDLYLINGWRLVGTEVAERGANRLYRNDGSWRLVDVTARAEVGDPGWGTGVAVGDIEGDGNPDFFVSNFGPDLLYRNRGDGRFEKVEEGPGIDGWSTGAVFFDADADGDEDLFLGAYVDCSLDDVLHAEPTLDWEGLKVMYGPFGLEGKANAYWENDGAGGFVERTQSAGLVDVGLFYTFAIIAADLDGDLDLDLYAANDSNPNYLYENQGGRFEEVGLWSGAALDSMGNAQAGMGLAAGDLDHDGRLDLFVTNFYKDVSTFYRNLGDLLFEDVTKDLGVGTATYAPLSWGAELADLDLDGRLDLVVANGHIYPQADEAPKAGTRFRQKNLLLRGTATGFADPGALAGPGFELVESSRGLASGDVDNDGDLDLVFWNMDAPPSLLRNESASRHAWLMVEAPADAVRFTVEAGSMRILRHRVRGGSYVSASDSRIHWGLGGAERADGLVVRWSNGQQTRYESLPVRRKLALGRP